jgi:hypothetical protein
MSIAKNRNPGLRYFSYDLIAAGNDWVHQTRADEARALKKLARLTERYREELDQLTSRIGRRAWQFFRYGYGPTGLHDGRLLSMTVGDGLDYAADARGLLGSIARRWLPAWNSSTMSKSPTASSRCVA